jgi:hypothetical protein
MKQVAWLLLVAVIAGIGYSLWRLRQVWRQRGMASEERYSKLLASTYAVPQAAPAALPAPDQAALSKQRLLLEAASKAGEAGEPALSIQLYARLLSRYPESSFVAQARAAVEVQKKKFSKP